MNIKGSCLCGSVEYEVEDISNNIYQCHCSMCRKQGGSASNTGTVIPFNQLKWVKGKSDIKSWTKNTGFRSDFCPNCGSLVPNPLRGLDYYWIPVGTLEDASFDIVANLYMDSKASWGVVSPTGKKFKSMPELEEFISLLSSNGHA